MEHLDADSLQALFAPGVTERDRAEALRHAVSCEQCWSLIASLISSPILPAGGPAIAQGTDVAKPRPPTPTGGDLMGSTLYDKDGKAVASSPPARGGLPPGTRVGRYVLADTLGAGGMGVVYAAEDPELHRRVAIKLLRRGSGDKGARARLLREAQAMARVSHPNVIAVYDVGTFGDDVFVAMELVDGGSLRQWLKQKPRTRREILDVFVAAGRGLAAAHAAGLVHRDFKPDNVLVGRDGRVFVTDFGLARAHGDPVWDEAAREAGEPRPLLDQPLTREGAVVGTPAYMAPEQHEGNQADARSDQFGFCIALYEALHRERPFPETSWDALRSAVAAGKVKEPPRDADVPPSLRKILLRGLAPRPGDRYSTMEGLLSALSRDRTRVFRLMAIAAAALLVSVVVALGADWVARERALAVARASFAASRDQLERSLQLRYETFVALSDLSYVLPVMREVTGSHDQADFGLGGEQDDARALQALHENLRTADWATWKQAAKRGAIAVADYKGRLLYTSAEEDKLGPDLRVLPAVTRAYDADVGVGAMVVRGDDPRLVSTGMTGGAPAPGLMMIFARGIVMGNKVPAVFVQAIEGKRLLGEVALGEGTQLTLIAPDGASEGTVPTPVLARAASVEAGEEPAQLAVGGRPWIVLKHPLRALDQQTVIGTVVLARQLDVGLAGLFSGARLVLGALALVLVGLIVTGTALARRR